jgi:sarcosine oxidase gamma subunit
MVDVQSIATIDGRRIRAYEDRDIHLAALRYFQSSGIFALRAADAIGVQIPSDLKCNASTDGGDDRAAILAWRSPTETILLCASTAAFANIERLCPSLEDGCFIDQTGAMSVIRVGGAGLEEFFSRLGNSVAFPKPGESTRSLLADVPVLSVRVEEGEILFIVDRYFGEHLMSWIRKSAADLFIATSGRRL